MTSNNFGEPTWLQRADLAFVKPAKPASLASRSFPRQSLDDVVPSPAYSGDTHRLAHKRRNLEGYSSNANPSLLFESSRLPLSERASGSGDQTLPPIPTSETPFPSSHRQGKDTSKRKQSKSPCLPLQPEKHPRCSVTGALDRSVGQKFALKRGVSIKPYVAERPSLAPRFNSSGSADFHSWIGHHPEDLLNESTIKNGFYDKPPPSQNESTTAKTSLLSSLRHKSGLQILSSLFVSVLDQRQSQSIINTNCTFKPPPRVTLTDTKRECWLRDLANPAIPLRRLSRTIPHGIRGKMLLDQCLAKHVPIPRAIWLAKCVGANEIRAFKRKGAGGAFAVGGEAKWIRDWTTNVEQFIESSIDICGGADWKAKIDYGLRLAAHLASEHLLDHDRYLSWILTSLKESSLDNLPVWICVAQIHLEQLVEQRKHGKYLAESLLSQLCKASELVNLAAYGAIAPQLLNILQQMIVNAPDCFLLPKVWHKYEAILNEQMINANDDIMASLEQISKRNSCFDKSLKDEPWQRPDTPRQRLIRILDTMPINGSFVKLSRDCLETANDFNLLVATCFEWAASLYRNGEARVYTVARLLRRCNAYEKPLDDPILNFLASASKNTGIFMGAVYRIIAELLRSKHFSASRLLSWLIARGGLRRIEALEQENADAQYLFEMPVQGMAPHVLNLRQTLLSRVGASIEDEVTTIASLKANIIRSIPNFFPAIHWPSTVREDSHELPRLSIAVKSTIAHWLRQAVAAHIHGANTETTIFPDSSNEGTRHIETVKDVSWRAITVDQFQKIRKVLVDLGEFSILADVLDIISETEDNAVFTAACDTTCYYFSIFAAIGAQKSLFINLVRRYEHMASIRRVDRSLLDSLIDLGKCLPAATKQINRLRQHAVSYQHNASTIACSPISDTMAEAIHQADSNSGEDIEQILISGTSVDTQTLKKLFNSIIQRFESPPSKHTLSAPVLADLLVQLRCFGHSTFDKLLKEWLSHALQSISNTVAAILLPLFCAGCLTLSTFLTAAFETLQGLHSKPQRAVLATNLLEVLASINADETLLNLPKGYRPRVEYEGNKKRCPTVMVSLLRVALDTCNGGGYTASPSGCTSHQRQELRRLVNDLIVYSPQAFDNISEPLGASGLYEYLAPDQGKHVSGRALTDDFESLLAHVNDFNLLPCRSRLNAALAESAISERDAMGALSSILMHDIRKMDQARLQIWPALVCGMAAHHRTLLQHFVVNEIFSSVLSDLRPLSPKSNETADVLLSVIEATSINVPDTAGFPIMARVTEKLNGFLGAQDPLIEPSKWGTFDPHDGNSRMPSQSTSSVYILLRLLTMQLKMADHSEFPQPTLYQLCVSLILLLGHPFFGAQPRLASYTFDLLILVSDCLHIDTRNRCISTLLDHGFVLDRRLSFILGFSDVFNHSWLHSISVTSARDEMKAIENAVNAMAPSHPFQIRRWEMLQDATPMMGENDTSLSLVLFGARKAIL